MAIDRGPVRDILCFYAGRASTCLEGIYPLGIAPSGLYRTQSFLSTD